MSKRNIILGCCCSSVLSNVASHADGFAGCRCISTDCPVTAFASLNMAWSRNASSVPREQPASAQSARLPSKTAAHRAVSTSRGNDRSPAAQVRVAKHPAPESIKMPRAKLADVQPAAKTAADSMARRQNVQSHPSSEAAPGSDATRAKIADSSPAGDAAVPTKSNSNTGAGDGRYGGGAGE